MQRQPIIWYLLLYALFLAAMHFGYGFGVAEPVLVFLLFGLGLSLLALWTTRHAKPRNITVKHPRQESAALGGYLAIVVGFITWGLPAVRLISARPMLRNSSPGSRPTSPTRPRSWSGITGCTPTLAGGRSGRRTVSPSSWG